MKSSPLLGEDKEHASWESFSPSQAGGTRAAPPHHRRVLVSLAFLGAAVVTSLALLFTLPDASFFSRNSFSVKLPSGNDNLESLTATTNRIQDRVGLIVKTGFNIAGLRIPIQLMESRADLPSQSFYYADADFWLGDVHIQDAYRDASEEVRSQDEFQAYYDVQHNLAINYVPGPDPKYWLLARYLEMFSLTRTYQANPSLDWYIVIDDDTYVFWPTMLRFLSHFKPTTEQHWFGHMESYNDILFSNGGGGTILSSQLMKATFGSVNDNSNFANREPDEYKTYFGGDTRLGKALLSHPDTTVSGPSGTPCFNYWPLARITWNAARWFYPILTLSMKNPVEMALVRQEEKRLSARQGRGDDLRHCDLYDSMIPPAVDHLRFANLSQTRKDRWVVKEFWLAAPRLSESYDNMTFYDCLGRCEATPDCTTYSYNPTSLNCLNSRQYDYSFGIESEDTLTGWDMHKIQEQMAHLDCSSVSQRNEAWRNAQEIFKA